MNSHILAGVLLVAGFLIFLTGAVRWRLVYQEPMVEALNAIHTDRRRRAWIHTWMVAAMFVTPSGLALLVVVLDGSMGRALAVVGTTVYLLGAGCFIVSLVFRLTVVPWAAEVTATDGTPPEAFEALDGWAGQLYVVHMATAYAGFAIVGAAVLGTGFLPGWLGWVGVVAGVLSLAGFVATRFTGPFNPPILAHTYTALVGVMLLLG